MKSLRLAWLSLLRRRVPTVITILSIAMAVACGGILLRLHNLSASRFASLGQGWDAIAGAKAGGIEILLNSLNSEGPYPGYLPYKLFESLRAEQSVRFEDGATATPSFLKSITPFLYFAKFEGARVVGTDETFLQPLGEGSALASGRWSTGEGEVVLGSAIARRLNLSAVDVQGAESEGANKLQIRVQPWVADHLGEAAVALKVVGILKPTDSAWDRQLYASVAQAQKVIAANRAYAGPLSIWNENVLNYFLIRLQPGGFRGLEALINRRTVGQVVLVEDERARLEELTGAGKSIGMFVSVFVLILSMLSVSSMLITRFEAMGVQLAVLRAIGYGRSAIARWLIWEGVLLGSAGCVLGAALDASLFPILRGLLGSALPTADVLASSPFESAPVWVLAMLATVSAIFIPLFRLYRQDVHQALKS